MSHMWLRKRVGCIPSWKISHKNCSFKKSHLRDAATDSSSPPQTFSTQETSLVALSGYVLRHLKNALSENNCVSKVQPQIFNAYQSSGISISPPPLVKKQLWGAYLLCLCTCVCKCVECFCVREKVRERYTKTLTCHLVFPFLFQISYPEGNLFGI